MNKPQSIIVIFSILLSGCVSDNTPQTISEFTPTSNVQDNTPEPISTITVKPSKEPTWTPVPTLSADIKKQNLFKLFLTNGDCDSPCWWGVGLGDPLQKAAELAPLLGEPLRSDKLISSYGYAISLGEFNEIRGLHIEYYVDDHQKVESMIVDLYEPSLYRDYTEAFEQSLSVESILKKYGMPSEILFLVKPRVEKDSPIAYALFVEYENLDFGVEYSGIVDFENPIKICSIKLDAPTLIGFGFTSIISIQ